MPDEHGQNKAEKEDLPKTPLHAYKEGRHGSSSEPACDDDPRGLVAMNGAHHEQPATTIRISEVDRHDPPPGDGTADHDRLPQRLGRADVPGRRLTGVRAGARTPAGDSDHEDPKDREAQPPVFGHAPPPGGHRPEGDRNAPRPGDERG
jgi:hypothetical protein